MSVSAKNSDAATCHKHIPGTTGTTSSTSFTPTGIMTLGLKSRTCTVGPIT